MTNNPTVIEELAEWEPIVVVTPERLRQIAAAIEQGEDGRLCTADGTTMTVLSPESADRDEITWDKWWDVNNNDKED